MKTITKISASILFALGLGLGGSAQAKSGHGGGGGHSGGGHGSGGHHGSGHHGGAHGISHYGRVGSGFYSYPRYGYSPYGSFHGSRSYYGYSGTRYYRGQVVYQQAADSLAAEVQIALARRGFYRGSIDGIIGSGTRRALRNFQIAERLPVTNRIDRSTVEALGVG